MVKKFWSIVKCATLENWIMGFAIIAGTLFLIAAITSAWCYYFPSFICYSSAVMVSDDRRTKLKVNKTKR